MAARCRRAVVFPEPGPPRITTARPGRPRHRADLVLQRDRLAGLRRDHAGPDRGAHRGDGSSCPPRSGRLLGDACSGSASRSDCGRGRRPARQSESSGGEGSGSVRPVRLRRRYRHGRAAIRSGPGPRTGPMIAPQARPETAWASRLPAASATSPATVRSPTPHPQSGTDEDHRFQRREDVALTITSRLRRRSPRPAMAMTPSTQ